MEFANDLNQIRAFQMVQNKGFNYSLERVQFEIENLKGNMNEFCSVSESFRNTKALNSLEDLKIKIQILN